MKISISQLNPTCCCIGKTTLGGYIIPTCYYRNKGEVDNIIIVDTCKEIEDGEFCIGQYDGIVKEVCCNIRNLMKRSS